MRRAKLWACAALMLALSPSRAEPASILVFGEPGGDQNSLVTTLEALGHAVITSASADVPVLDGFDTVWHVGAFLPLSATSTVRLVEFVKAGGGLHLTGERPCCDPLNESLDVVIASLVLGGSSITVGGQGDVVGPYSFNPLAAGGVTTGPNVLTTWNGAGVGAISGVSGAKVLAIGSGAAVGAVWGSADLVGGAGRLSILMDGNWFSASGSSAVVQNLQTFLAPEPATLYLLAAGACALALRVRFARSGRRG